MATDKDFSTEDWHRIEASPYMAALAISYADLSSKKGIADEAAATGDAIRSATTSSSEVVRTLATRASAGIDPVMPAIPNTPADAQVVLIDGCRSALAVVAARAPGEAAAFATFLVETAKAAAAGSREGGLLGVGFTRVSEDETMAIAALSLALGLPDA